MLSGTKERVSQYLTLLVRCEEAVGEFYRVCAETWPEEAGFWQNLADEELDHAVRLEMVQARIRATPHGIGLVHPYPEGTLQAFHHSVRKSAALVRAGTVTKSAALALARDLEQSRIGSQPLRGLSFDDPRFARYEQEFSADILEHAQRIVDRLQQNRSERATAA